MSGHRTTARLGGAVDAAGYVVFHSQLPESPAWPAETPPILILHRVADGSPRMADVADFAAEAAGLTYDIEVYSGAPRAFMVFGSERYRERADQRSCAEFQRILDERLGAAS